MRLSAWSFLGVFGSGVPLATEFLGGFKWGDVTDLDGTTQHWLYAPIDV